jgi:hypothetical protein
LWWLIDGHGVRVAIYLAEEGVNVWLDVLGRSQYRRRGNNALNSTLSSARNRTWDYAPNRARGFARDGAWRRATSLGRLVIEGKRGCIVGADVRGLELLDEFSGDVDRLAHEVIEAADGDGGDGLLPVVFWVDERRGWEET